MRVHMATRDALVSEIRDRLTRTGSPRLTILIILAFAGAAAFLTSFVGLSAGVDSMALRYAFASIVGYLAFVVLIRGWIAVRRGWTPDGDLPDPFEAVVDAVMDAGDLVGRGVARGAQAARGFAGGQSGGGGGGSAWIPEPLEPVAPMPPVSPVQQVATVPHASPATSEGGGSGFSIDLDDGFIFILLAILAALGGILCVGYVIYIAPMLLAEVALDAALVTAVYSRLRREDRAGHWTGAVLRQTLVPAAILVFFMFVAGFAAQLYAPEARSIGGVIRVLLS
jgi:hypothetical protein